MTKSISTFTGRHVLAELDGASPVVLDDELYLRGALESALRECGATVCQVVSKRFSPQGVTVLALLSESHASLHSYPEIGSAFVDVFTCGQKPDPELAVRSLAGALGASVARCQTLCRGL
jgi:S-adenosylmethionine decarboxylase proenzyme